MGRARGEEGRRGGGGDPRCWRRGSTIISIGIIIGIIIGTITGIITGTTIGIGIGSCQRSCLRSFRRCCPHPPPLGGVGPSGQPGAAQLVGQPPLASLVVDVVALPQEVRHGSPGAVRVGLADLLRHTPEPVLGLGQEVRQGFGHVRVAGGVGVEINVGPGSGGGRPRLPPLRRCRHLAEVARKVDQVGVAVTAIPRPAVGIDDWVLHDDGGGRSKKLYNINNNMAPMGSSSNSDGSYIDLSYTLVPDAT